MGAQEVPSCGKNEWGGARSGNRWERSLGKGKIVEAVVGVGGEGEKELVLGRSRCGEGVAPVLGRDHDLRPQLLLLPGQG